MTTFDDRENAYENKFAYDEELKFKSIARRNRLLGLWAAEKLGKSGEDKETYAREVVRADFAEPGEEDVFRKVKADLEVGGVACSDEELRQLMRRFLVEAAEQIEATR
ncbi:DUF1476 domain-containing protein [Afifella marina]|uniref:DUF1476 domain-containing protein n=1 Tax=Afifella marina DSM 2698 TaxID=1120955 RepID=A0A1G5P8L6_AFIMA|nr:DUF1476 domain-containing protein [Afifella marina]MBK1625342.1 DUF1476 domain-containing protein [Afifella marina DSM 2698]MBK1628884.1 DUF1476 domain-containing protein [Afifella marina]MBK5916886.1 hypothetical protein [Afifella marina]RAI17900.1 hypothetical protein CH311_16800 [Afifella marina DSM 2698]SCZ45903.1 hypothetical protein SAMN03080610_03523 [Afifella marina DSM 2698]